MTLCEQTDAAQRLADAYAESTSDNNSNNNSNNRMPPVWECLAFLPGLMIGLALYHWLTYRNPAVAEWFRGGHR